MPDPARMGLDAWKALAQRGEAPADAVLLKSYVAEVQVADGDGSARAIDFTISTGTVDRERDTIAPAGWKLAAFKKNPVVLWAHDYRTPPVARASHIRVEDDRLRARAEFAPADAYPFADTIYRLLQGGFLRATSVGFRPLKHSRNDERGGIDFEEQELLEFSVVPVPANAECLMDAKAAGIDVELLREWAAKTLERLVSPAGQESAPVTDPMRLDLQVVTDEPVEKPLPNEHACRLRDPGDFQENSFRRMEREHGGKKYSVIMGRLTGETALTEQAYRYPKKTWTAASARGHCRSHDGNFEAASEEGAVGLFELVEDGIDLDAIPGVERDALLGDLMPADVLTALRDVIREETGTGVRRAVNSALGRVD
mgnify:CR=1 FL=1